MRIFRKNYPKTKKSGNLLILTQKTRSKSGFKANTVLVLNKIEKKIDEISVILHKLKK